MLQRDRDTGTAAPAMNQAERGGAKHQLHVELQQGCGRSRQAGRKKGKEALLKHVERRRRRKKRRL